MNISELLFLWGTDVGHVWGWGYGGEGQLGLGTRMRIVSSPQLIPCFNSPENVISSSGAPIPGSSIKAIACGGRHSAIVTGEYAITTCKRVEDKL